MKLTKNFLINWKIKNEFFKQKKKSKFFEKLKFKIRTYHETVETLNLISVSCNQMLWRCLDVFSTINFGRETCNQKKVISKYCYD